MYQKYFCQSKIEIFDLEARSDTSCEMQTQNRRSLPPKSLCFIIQIILFINLNLRSSEVCQHSWTFMPCRYPRSMYFMFMLCWASIMPYVGPHFGQRLNSLVWHWSHKHSCRKIPSEHQGIWWAGKVCLNQGNLWCGVVLHILMWSNIYLNA